MNVYLQAVAILAQELLDAAALLIESNSSLHAEAITEK